jgi:hypothetical protein
MTSWRDVRSSDFYVELELDWDAGLLSTLGSHVSELERHLGSDLSRFMERARAALDARGAQGADPRRDEFLSSIGDEHTELEERSAVVRSAIYLIAVGHFEYRVRILLSHHGISVRRSANISHMIEKPEVQTALINFTDDYDDLRPHIKVLRELRNELAHGGGVRRAALPESLTPLLQSGDLEVIEDLPDYAVIKISGDFVQRVLADLHQAFRATSLALRSEVPLSEA